MYLVYHQAVFQWNLSPVSRMNAIKTELTKTADLAGLVFPLTELLEATGQRDQDNLLGEGGFGVVYKGCLRHTVVAVKFLTKVR